MEFNINVFKEKTEALKLLYVEEDKDIRQPMQKTLSRFFPHIDVSGNGQEAYELFLENKHDIIDGCCFNGAKWS